MPTCGGTSLTSTSRDASDETTRSPKSTLRELEAMKRALPCLRAGSAFLPIGRVSRSLPSACCVSLVASLPGRVKTVVRVPSCSSTTSSVSGAAPCGSTSSSSSPVWPMSGPGLLNVSVGPAERPAMNHTPPATRSSRKRTANTLRIRVILPEVPSSRGVALATDAAELTRTPRAGYNSRFAHPRAGIV